MIPTGWVHATVIDCSFQKSQQRVLSKSVLTKNRFHRPFLLFLGIGTAWISTHDVIVIRFILGIGMLRTIWTVPLATLQTTFCFRDPLVGRQIIPMSGIVI